MKDCKWYAENGICTNGDCPACADYCPCGEYVGLCKHYEEERQVWGPKINEEYFFIGLDGTIYCNKSELWAIDNNMYNIGNCFKTKEEAKFAIEKLKVIAELKRFAEEYNEGEIDWDNCSQKYVLYFNYNTNHVEIDCWQKLKFCDIYFTSREVTQKAIETIGEERLKIYYFEVE